MFRSQFGLKPRINSTPMEPLSKPIEVTQVVCFGSNVYGQCKVPPGLTPATAVAAGVTLGFEGPV